MIKKKSVTYSMLGRTYGLLVVRDAYTKKLRNAVYTTYVNCMCACGNEVDVVAYDVRSGHTTSCGCYRTTSLRRHRTPEESAFRKLWGHYTNNAKRRNYSWELTREQFKALVTQPCYWCGIAPEMRSLAAKTGTNTEEWNSKLVIKVAGIDRVDNNFGYTITNSVPCCTDCNLIKHARSPEDFLNKIRLIYKKHG